ncbi:MAG TPA: DUF6049 family protein [Acidimicrobiales bacterium]|nr:DUF6049 family protein [Acidimicrobiales bacterium]
MLKRWAGIALCTLALSSPAWAGAQPGVAGPPLTLTFQTASVTPTAPWFTLDLGVGATSVPVGDLHLSITFYSRLSNDSQLQQATNATPQKTPLITVRDIPVSGPAGARSATTCVTVLPQSSTEAPAAGTPGACPPDDQTLVLGCVPDMGECGDVYPVSVALLRQGDTTPLSRFTTFLTYQESVSAESSTGGPLRVSVVIPVTTSSPDQSAADRRRTEALTTTLAAHRAVPITLQANPSAVTDLAKKGGKTGHNALQELAGLTNAPGPDQLPAQPYVPINLAALSGAGLNPEIETQLDRGAALLHQSDLHPSGGPWVDTASTFTTANADSLANGLTAARVDHLVLNDTSLTPLPEQKSTFAQTFTLALGRTAHVTATAANSQLDSRFTADAGDPVLAANQLLSSLNFIHFENAFDQDPRGVVITPPPSWRPQSAFLTTLLNGLTNNPALSPVTLDQLFNQVQPGGNGEPASLHLQSGSPPAGSSISANAAGHLSTARSHLNSFGAAVHGHPAVLTTLSDGLLAVEYRGNSPTQRASALARWNLAFGAVLGQISLASENTITFTSRTAPIPITVLSTAPYTVTVVMTLVSDKFNFPSGSTRTLVLNRQTTPVRIQARSRTSGDRLPVDVTLRTPDGGLVIAQTQVTVHSTSLSIVGVVLTLLAGLTLLIWWARTWHKGRRRRPRAH